MTAHLTAAEARALGIVAPDAPPARHRTTRRALPRDRAVSVCCTCDERFDTDAAETRHVAATFHVRYRCDVSPLAYPGGMTDTEPTVPDPDAEPVDPDAEPVEPDAPAGAPADDDL